MFDLYGKIKILTWIAIISSLVFASSFIIGFTEGILYSKYPRLESSPIWMLFIDFVEQSVIIFISVRSFRSISNDNPFRFIQYDFVSVIIGIIIGLVLYFASNLLHTITLIVMPVLKEYDLGGYTIYKNTDITNIAYYVISFCILVPLSEEIFFRGVCYRLLKTRYSIFLSIGFSSIIFVFFHPNLSWIPHLILITTVLCLLFDKTQNLLTTIVAHSTFNFIIIMYK